MELRRYIGQGSEPHDVPLLVADCGSRWRAAMRSRPPASCLMRFGGVKTEVRENDHSRWTVSADPMDSGRRRGHVDPLRSPRPAARRSATGSASRRCRDDDLELA